MGATLPANGRYVRAEAGQTVAQVIWHMVLPVATLSFGFIAGYSRYIRSTMLEAMGQDYIRTAKAKGLPQREIVYIHALKNAAIPIVTIVAWTYPSCWVERSSQSASLDGRGWVACSWTMSPGPTLRW